MSRPPPRPPTAPGAPGAAPPPPRAPRPTTAAAPRPTTAGGASAKRYLCMLSSGLPLAAVLQRMGVDGASPSAVDAFRAEVAAAAAAAGEVAGHGRLLTARDERLRAAAVPPPAGAAAPAAAVVHAGGAGDALAVAVPTAGPVDAALVCPSAPSAPVEAVAPSAAREAVAALFADGIALTDGPPAAGRGPIPAFMRSAAWYVAAWQAVVSDVAGSGAAVGSAPSAAAAVNADAELSGFSASLAAAWGSLTAHAEALAGDASDADTAGHLADAVALLPVPPLAVPAIALPPPRSRVVVPLASQAGARAGTVVVLVISRASDAVFDVTVCNGSSAGAEYHPIALRGCRAKVGCAFTLRGVPCSRLLSRAWWTLAVHAARARMPCGGPQFMYEVLFAFLADGVIVERWDATAGSCGDVFASAPRAHWAPARTLEVLARHVMAVDCGWSRAQCRDSVLRWRMAALRACAAADAAGRGVMALASRRLAHWTLRARAQYHISEDLAAAACALSVSCEAAAPCERVAVPAPPVAPVASGARVLWVHAGLGAALEDDGGAGEDSAGRDEQAATPAVLRARLEETANAVELVGWLRCFAEAQYAEGAAFLGGEVVGTASGSALACLRHISAVVPRAVERLFRAAWGRGFGEDPAGARKAVFDLYAVAGIYFAATCVTAPCARASGARAVTLGAILVVAWKFVEGGVGGSDGEALCSHLRSRRLRPCSVDALGTGEAFASVTARFPLTSGEARTRACVAAWLEEPSEGLERGGYLFDFAHVGGLNVRLSETHALMLAVGAVGVLPHAASSDLAWATALEVSRWEGNIVGERGCWRLPCCL